MNAIADRSALHEIAAALRAAEETGTPIAQITVAHPGLDLAGAYRVQAINVAARRDEAGPAGRVVGHKIGLTSKAMQEMLGVDEPDYGVLYADRVHAGGGTLSVAGLLAPRIEPEFAFILSEDLPGPGVSADDVRAATEAVVPALEVIDSRIANWKIGLVDTIADNASCHCAVLGPQRHPLTAVDLPAARVELIVDGEIVQRGDGAAVLGDPAVAVAWLANALAGHGAVLKAGHIVLSGSMTAAVPFTAGSHVVASFGALGSVEVTAQ